MPDAPATPSPSAGLTRMAATQVERHLVLIVVAFGILYSLQNLDTLIAGWPSMAGPVGVAVVALVAGSCVLPVLAVPRAGLSRQVLLGAAAAYG